MASYMWPTPKPNDLTAPLQLPAVPGSPLTTQGGNTLDDGNGAAALHSLDVNGPANMHTELYSDYLYSYSAPSVTTAALHINGAGTVHSGTGAPTIAGTAGDLFFRTDTPTVTDQRIYVCTVTGGAGAATWVGIV